VSRLAEIFHDDTGELSSKRVAGFIVLLLVVGLAVASVALGADVTGIFEPSVDLLKWLFAWVASEKGATALAQAARRKGRGEG
jgi:hypothetical protein